MTDSNHRAAVENRRRREELQRLFVTFNGKGRAMVSVTAFLSSDDVPKDAKEAVTAYMVDVLQNEIARLDDDFTAM